MKYLSIISLMLLAALMVSAQEGETACDYGALAAELDSMVVLLITADEPEPVLDDIQTAIRAARAECLGLVFSSEVDGMQPVIGPVVIPEGLYRVIFVNDGIATITLDVLDGTCSDRAAFAGMPFITSMEIGGAEVTIEALLESEGCEALLLFDSVLGSGWTLEFERLR